LGQAMEAAEGLNALLGIDDPALRGSLLKLGLEAVELEFAEHGDAQDKANLHYVLHGAAADEASKEFPPHVREDYARGSYHGGALPPGDYDHGHGGMRLDDFVAHPHAQIAKLSRSHVLALRLYTTSSYRLLNAPLRARAKPHPFRMTVFYLAEGLKKLRAVSAQLEPDMFNEVVWLYRGMRDMTVDASTFMVSGGTELACMSTTRSHEVARKYAASQVPLIFKYKTRGLGRGCSLEFLSVYPKEKEYLYPPLTYLQPEATYEDDGMSFVEVTPQMA